MRTDIRISPESEEEVEFLEKLSEAREYALEETTLGKADVGIIFGHFATGMFTEISGQKPDDVMTECPKCETGIEDVTAGELGGAPELQPCGCTVEWSDLPEDVFMED